MWINIAAVEGINDTETLICNYYIWLLGQAKLIHSLSSEIFKITYGQEVIFHVS